MTTIEWTDKSTNPIRAYHRQTGAVGHYCEKLSSGCAYCYASNLQRRFKMPEFPGKSRLEKLALMDDRGRVIVNDNIELGLEQHALDSVLKRKKPTMWFWCDMTDMFGSWVPTDWIGRCFDTMKATPQHSHQVLTKRVKRMCEFVAAELAAFGPTQMAKNLWLGTSCENQATFDERYPWLDKTPAAVQFLSLEPLLGPINITPFLESYRKRWVIVGGESGFEARACYVEWIEAIVEECKLYGVPVFVKQLGKQASTIARYGNNKRTGLRHPLYLKHPKGGDQSEWPEHLRIRQFPYFQN